MKTIKPSSLLLVILLMSVPPVEAQVGLEKVAQSTMNFLQVGISPRASALGEAYSAIGQGAESIFFNPAGIVETKPGFDVRIFSTQWIADINYMAAAIAWNAEKYGSIGLSFLTVDYGTFRGTSLVYGYEQSTYPHGYKETGDFTVGSHTLGLTYGKAISTQFLVGGTVRYANQNLGQNTFYYYSESQNDTSGVINIDENYSLDRKNDASKLVFNAGVKYYTYSRNLWFGMSIRNFASNLKREEIFEQLPLQFNMGMAANVLELLSPDVDHANSLLLTLDFQHPNNYTERLGMGVEYTVRELISLRGGYYSNHDLASWSLGFGVNAELAGKPINLDYSYSNMELFDGVNRFSIAFSL